MEMVWPEEITFDDNSISPPPPVEVTEHDRTSSVVALKIVATVTVEARDELPSVIVLAVANPVAAAPKAVVLKVRMQIRVESSSINRNVPNPVVEGASIWSTTASASRFRIEVGCVTAMIASYWTTP